MWAVFNGNVEIVKKLISRGDANCGLIGTNGWTPLQLAADRAHIQVIQVLLNTNTATSTIDAVNSDGDTAVIIAAKMGHAAEVRALVEAGTRIDIYNKDQNALDFALKGGSEGGFPTIVEILLQKQ